MGLVVAALQAAQAAMWNVELKSCLFLPRAQISGRWYRVFWSDRTAVHGHECLMTSRIWLSLAEPGVTKRRDITFLRPPLHDLVLSPPTARASLGYIFAPRWVDLWDHGIAP